MKTNDQPAIQAHVLQVGAIRYRSEPRDPIDHPCRVLLDLDEDAAREFGRHLYQDVEITVRPKVADEGDEGGDRPHQPAAGQMPLGFVGDQFSSDLIEACRTLLKVVDEAYEATGYFRVAKTSHERILIESAIANASGREGVAHE